MSHAQNRIPTLAAVSLCLLIPVASLFAAHQSPQQGAAPSTKPLAPSAQAAPQTGPTIKSDTKLVTMLAAVRDKHGNLIHDLTKDDFVVQQDGHPQTITYFAQDPSLPLTVGLLVDTSLSQRHVLDQERGASGAFLDHMFDAADAAAQTTSASAPAATAAKAPPTQPADQTKDKAFIVRFDYEVELVQDITASREKLETALRTLDTPEFSQSRSNPDPDDPPDGQQGGQQGHGHHRGGTGAGTLLYDAIYLSAEDITKKVPGRKALVLLTDGDDRGSKESLENAIETAQRADTVVYSILFKDPDAQNFGGGYGGPHGGGGRGGGMGGGGRGGGGYPQESRPDGKKVLERISRETGGRFFEVTKKQSIDDIYAQINEELRSQYSIGYKPEAADAGPGYHHISLTAKRKDTVIQTREGYYSQ